MSLEQEKFEKRADELQATMAGISKTLKEEIPSKTEFEKTVAEVSSVRESVDKMAADFQQKHNEMTEALKEVNVASMQKEEYHEERSLLGASIFYDALFTNKGKGSFKDIDLTNTNLVSGKVAKKLERFVKEETKRLETKMATVLDTGTSTSASEWMGTEYLKMIREQIRHPLSVEGGLLDVIQVEGHNILSPKKTATMYENGSNHWENAGIQSVAEKAAPSAHSTLASGQNTRSLAKAMGTTTYSYEVVSDSFVDMANEIARDLVYSLEQAKEYAYINAATTIGDVFSGGNASTTSLINAFDGFLATARGGSSSVNMGAANLTLDGLRGLYAPMGAAGLSPRMSSFLVEAYGMVQLLNLDEVLTIDKYGNNATVRKGELGMIDGRKIFISDHLHRALATGIYDTATPNNNVLTTILYIKEPVWKLYVKNGILLEEDRNITTQVITKAISQRLLLVDDSVNEDAAGYIRNIS